MIPFRDTFFRSEENSKAVLAKMTSDQFALRVLVVESPTGVRKMTPPAYFRDDTAAKAMKQIGRVVRHDTGHKPCYVVTVRSKWRRA